MYGKYLWSLNCWARAGAMMVYCNLMVTTMVDSNEMFVNEAIHQGTDMRHPMCPNAIFSILGPKKGPKIVALLAVKIVTNGEFAKNYSRVGKTGPIASFLIA